MTVNLLFMPNMSESNETPPVPPPNDEETNVKTEENNPVPEVVEQTMPELQPATPADDSTEAKTETTKTSPTPESQSLPEQKIVLETEHQISDQHIRDQSTVNTVPTHPAVAEVQTIHALTEANQHQAIQIITMSQPLEVTEHQGIPIITMPHPNEHIALPLTQPNNNNNNNNKPDKVKINISNYKKDYIGIELVLTDSTETLYVQSNYLSLLGKVDLYRTLLDRMLLTVSVLWRTLNDVTSSILIQVFNLLFVSETFNRSGNQNRKQPRNDHPYQLPMPRNGRTTSPGKQGKCQSRNTKLSSSILSTS
ncbi:hypothetical protein KUTeg_003839 [Tegillarca granosa]|uniref:Uncharacterized protein n=1 Tax=Tegillarca granosa TaxID=220873 RepID=A0ABQ9FSS8_TEGGR|nr:hypothetical protein KUTeg_003839 [Tegillarca granosa]